MHKFLLIVKFSETLTTKHLLSFDPSEDMTFIPADAVNATDKVSEATGAKNR